MTFKIEETEKSIHEIFMQGLAKDFKSNIIYFHENMIAFICPCGCGRLIYFEINKNGSWTFDKETITITPSILRKNPNPNNPCTAHFWITNGEVVWC